MIRLDRQATIVVVTQCLLDARAAALRDVDKHAFYWREVTSKYSSRSALAHDRDRGGDLPWIGSQTDV